MGFAAFAVICPGKQALPLVASPWQLEPVHDIPHQLPILREGDPDRLPGYHGESLCASLCLVGRGVLSNGCVVGRSWEVELTKL
jgi:hypothetical protein